MSDELDPKGFYEDDPDEAPPTAGERLLHALGQLYRLWREDRLPVHPSFLAVEDIARIAGVFDQLEFTTADETEQRVHFPGEVLVAQTGRPFSWRLLTVDRWVAERELADLDEPLRDLGFDG